MDIQARPGPETDSPFHPGERLVQTLSGVREEAEQRGQRMLSADINTRQQEFFEQLPFVVAADTDRFGQPWAGLISTLPGFFRFEENNHKLNLDWSFGNNLTAVQSQSGSSLGLLGIELHTRRRNRLNATVNKHDQQLWQLDIDQGYGNCPKYITERQWPAELFSGSYVLQQSATLNTSAMALIASSDTFFIASSAGPTKSTDSSQASAWGADVSHRGGEPGFLEFKNNKLYFEDYPGNNMFNTLGNLQQYPRCGLLLVDFNTGDLLQIAAKAALNISARESEVKREISLEILHCQWWQHD